MCPRGWFRPTSMQQNWNTKKILWCNKFAQFIKPIYLHWIKTWSKSYSDFSKSSKVLKTNDEESNLPGVFLIDFGTTSSTVMLPVICIWINFKSLLRLSFIVVPNAAFNFLISNATLFASHKLLGDVAPINKNFLKFFKKINISNFQSCKIDSIATDFL